MKRLLIAMLVCAGSACAHEIGTTRVNVQLLEGGKYDLEIVTDASALLDKLEDVTGGTSPAGTSPKDAGITQIKTLLTNFDSTFRGRVRLSFDGVAAQPVIAYSVEPPVDALSAISATIHLTGDVPANARNFTWNYGWTFASYAIGIHNAVSANTATEWLEGDTSKTFALAGPVNPASRWRTAARYLTLGFTHIVPLGFDHVLFVLGIYLLSRNAKAVLMQVSAFTIAHSITLGLSMYGLIHVSSKIVEPMIAVSIAYVAIENVFLSELKSWRVALVFLFGLLHGMGFAGALKELGLPHSEFVTALVTFNLGVEAGQLTVIAAAFLLVGWHYANRPWYRARVVIPASAMIACMALYWTVERLAA